MRRGDTVEGSPPCRATDLGRLVREPDLFLLLFSLMNIYFPFLRAPDAGADGWVDAKKMHGKRACPITVGTGVASYVSL